MTIQRTASGILPGAAAAFCAVTAVGGFILGFGTYDGRALVLACFLAGIALSLTLWMRYGRAEHSRVGANRYMVLMFCVMAGMGLYSNVSYLLWGLGFPMAIRTIETGAMSGNAWLPPLTLVWAVLCWRAIKKAG